MTDLSRQLQRMLAEVQALQAGAPGATSPPPAAFAGGDANDVTTQVLLEFKDIQVGLGSGGGRGSRVMRA